MSFQGVTQSGLAVACGTTTAAVSQWACGQTEPSQRNLRVACTALGISLQVFWGPIPDDKEAA
jgi:transcriptional regulator with XRE-family HTH domain